MKKKNKSLFLWTAIFTMMEPQYVEMLVSLPNLALGNEMQGGESFRILEKRVQMTQFVKKSSFQHLVTAGNCYKIRPVDDGGWRKFTPLPYPKTRALAAIPAGTIIGCDSIDLQTKRYNVSCDI